MSYRTAHKAFTLVEMLVSLAIVSTIMTLVYGSYAATSRSMEAYSSRMSCAERAHLVLRLMARQLRCAYLPPATTDTVRTDTGIPTAPVAAFQAEPPGLRADMLRFTTTGGLDAGLDGPVGVSRVAYRYDRPSATLSICRAPGAYGPGGARDAGAWRPVLGGVTSIELEFHDGRQWQSRWDSRRDGQLPQAVKIALVIADDRGRAHRYATTVPIVCRAAVRQGQQGKRSVGQL